MSQRIQMAFVLILGIALGAGATWLSMRFAGGKAGGPQPVTTAVSDAGSGGIAARNPGWEWVPPPRNVPPGAEKYRQPLPDLSGQDEPEVLLEEVRYPRFAKLTSRPLSEVPHSVLGAWDEDRDSSEPGRRRAFVLVVEPGLSDGELAALARDVRDRERDAVILDVRIYDSESAARRPRALDGGAAAFEHLVAEVKRNDRIPLDVIRIHGRPIEP